MRNRKTTEIWTEKINSTQLAAGHPENGGDRALRYVISTMREGRFVTQQLDPVEAIKAVADALKHGVNTISIHARGLSGGRNGSGAKAAGLDASGVAA